MSQIILSMFAAFLIAVTPTLVLAKSKKSNKSTASTQAQKKGAATESDKLDISDLEQKYWAPKDTNFNVVQNRTYSKAKRMAVSATYGNLINDSCSRAGNLSLSGTYYFTERYGVELNYTSVESSDNKLVETFVNDFGTTPDHGKVTSYIGTSFNWVPFYAKMSLLGSRILYFDMSISPGLGMTTYNQQTDAGSRSKQAPTLTIDVTQSVFFSKNFAIRIDFKNRFFQEEVIEFRKSPATLASGDDNQKIRTDFTQNTLLMFGLTFFY